ncbi:uncharacterized protein LOC121422953 [Lytechinus variegatus]|uniref:uncharacterized protein LOC121422953 n=1 Tax=Lytechinus variegatus TaxID=7654 RepID=UPI001BB1DA99|nr:uncharacterized protein LOC121422953 [Lytechinus variegatus]
MCAFLSLAFQMPKYKQPRLKITTIRNGRICKRYISARPPLMNQQHTSTFEEQPLQAGADNTQANTDVRPNKNGAEERESWDKIKMPKYKQPRLKVTTIRNGRICNRYISPRPPLMNQQHTSTFEEQPLQAGADNTQANTDVRPNKNGAEERESWDKIKVNSQ